jgi:SH3-like domain-containing protein
MAGLIMAVFIVAPHVNSWSGAKSALAVEAVSLPYFASLKSGEVNLRTGPGLRYPIEWVYKRRFLPVLVLQTFDNWRQIRDWEGIEGWVHQNMLSSTRTVIVTRDRVSLLKDAREDTRVVALVKTGVIAILDKCRGPWCHIDASGVRGWLSREVIWGINATGEFP